MIMNSLRDAFGKSLTTLGVKYQNLVVVDADNSFATRTVAFRDKYPSRFINVGCAEQNMIGVAAGIALTGMPVVCSTFSIFLCGRAFEQIRHSICQNGLSVVLVGTHSGITVGKDGPSHFSFEDIALMRSIPNMQVLSVSSAEQITALLESSILSNKPTYIRLSRFMTNHSAGLKNFYIGGADLLESGKDISIFFCGVIVDRVKRAVSIIKDKGFTVELVDVYSIKPLEERVIIASLTKTKKAIVVEEHNKHGGLGDAITNLSCQHYPARIEHICLDDTFAESGDPDDLLDKYGFTAENIANKALNVILK